MLKLEIDQPVTAKLLKQQPRPDTGKYPGNIYTLEVDGAVVDFRATDNVHRAIQDKVQEGMAFDLVKRQHRDIPGRTIIWVNVPEETEAPDKYYESPKNGSASSEMLPMIERMLKDVNALSKDLKHIQGYFKLQKPEVPINDDGIPF